MAITTQTDIQAIKTDLETIRDDVAEDPQIRACASDAARYISMLLYAARNRNITEPSDWPAS